MIWSVTGPGSGTVGGVAFEGFEHLSGAAGNQDTFVFDAAGAITGVVDGGAGGFDTLVVDAAHRSLRSVATGPNSGSLVLGGTTIAYDGLEPITVTGTADVVVAGGIGDDQLVVEIDPANAVMLLVRSVTGTIESVSLTIPTGSLTVDGADGDDSIAVAGNVVTQGANVKFVAETITVNAGVLIDTRQRAGGTATTGASGSIELIGEDISIVSGARLLAGVDAGSTFAPGAISITAHDAPNLAASIAAGFSPILFTDRHASVTINGATIDGGAVTITADGGAQTAWNDPGDYWNRISEDLLATLQSFPDLFLSSLSPISGQVKIQRAAAEVLLTDTAVTSAGNVTVKATSDADASFVAVGINADLSNAASVVKFILVVGYGMARAASTVDLAGTTSIVAEGDVLVTSSAATAADVKTRAAANTVLSPKSDVEWAFSIAIVVSEEISHVTLGPATRIESRLGSVDVFAQGKGGGKIAADAVIFLDGTGAISIGIGVDTADVRARVDGTITAESPSVRALAFTAGASLVSVANDTVTLTVPVGRKLTRGQRLVYDAGAESAIGGLVDGREYVVESVEDLAGAPAGYVLQRIRLTDGLTIDLDKTQVDPGSVHSLGQLAVVTFDSASVADVGGAVSIDLDVLGDGQTVRYLGPSGSNKITVRNARFTPAATGDVIELLDPADPDWTFTPIYVGQQIRVQSAESANDDRVLRVKSIGERTLVVEEVNQVVAGIDAGFEVLTLPESPQPIGGLVIGQSYEVDVVGGRIRLRDLDTGAVVQFTTAGAGIQGFAYTSRTFTFAPSTAVDNELDTIELAGHGLRTGALAIYSTDPNNTVSVPLHGFVDTTPTGVITTVTLPDAPIDGLSNAYAYYVVVVDADHIRLVGTSLAAYRALPIDLTTTGTGSQSFTAPALNDGINVHAEHEGENLVAAGVELSDAAQPWSSVVEGAFQGNAESLASLALNGPAFGNYFRDMVATRFGATPFQGPAPDPGTPATPGFELPLDIAGTVAITVFKHTVEAIIGAGAVLKSGKDIAVTAELDESVQMISQAEATRNGSAVADGREDVEIALAVALAVATSSAHALVEGTLDASNNITVASTVAYPHLVDRVEDALNPAVTLKEEGLDGFTFMLDGTLGLASGLFNVYTVALAGNPADSSGDIFVIGASVALGFYTLDSTAIIAGTARINQDPAYRTPTQSVTVRATTLMQIVEVTSIAALNLSLTTLIDAGSNIGAASPLETLREFVNPFGVSGKRGIGPAVTVTKVSGPADGAARTLATIGEGARVHTGVDGDGLTVEADQNLFGVSVTYAGTKASDFGLTASVIVALFHTLTEGAILSGASVTGGAVNVNARDKIDRYTIVGAFVLGDQVGVGVSVGVNIVDRATRSHIGGRDPPAGTPRTTIDVAGAVKVTATTTGNLFSLVLGGALSVPEGEPPAGGDPPTAPPANQIDLTALFAISVAVNVVDIVTEAFIASADVTAANVEITATSEPVARAVVIAAAVSVSKPPGTTNVSVGTFNLDISAAGAIAVNDFDGVTTASLTDSTVTTTAGGVLVKALDDTRIAADGGGVAVALSLGQNARGGTRGSTSLAVGASVAVNTVDNDVRALVVRSTISSAADVVVEATSTTHIEAVTIAGALTGGGGGPSAGTVIAISAAGAGSGNDVSNVIEAAIRDAIATPGPAIVAAGGVRVSAIDDSTITADAGGFAIALVWSAQGSFFSLAIGLSAAKNDIANTITATIANSTVRAGGRLDAGSSFDGVVVEATSTATIDALTIAGSAASLAGSGAGSGNDIANTIEASITGAASDVSATGGHLRVTTADTSTVGADAGGVAVAVTITNNNPSRVQLAGAIGVTIAINNIGNDVRAIVDAARVTASGDVTVSATAIPVIRVFSLAGTLAVRVNTGGSGAFGLAFAGAGTGSGNAIDNLVEATARNGARLVSTGARVRVLASMPEPASGNANITATAIGVAIAVNVGASGGPAVTIGIGAAVAINAIGSGRGNVIRATVDRATITAPSAVDVMADAAAEIVAVSVGAAVSAAANADGWTITGAGAGASATSTIHNTVEALVVNTGDVCSGGRDAGQACTGAGGLVSVTARNAGTIRGDAGAGAFAGTYGKGGSLAIGVGLSTNTLQSTTRAAVTSDARVSGASVAIDAVTTGAITSIAVGVAISLAASSEGVTIALSGAGASATNTIRETVQALVDDATVAARAGNVAITATDTTTADANAVGGSVAIAVSTGNSPAIAGAIGVGLADNTLDNDVVALVDHAAVIAATGRVDVTATSDRLDTSKARLNALAVAVAVSVAFVPDPRRPVGVAISGAGTDAKNTSTNSISAEITGGSNVTADGVVPAGTADADDPGRRIRHDHRHGEGRCHQRRCGCRRRCGGRRVPRHERPPQRGRRGDRLGHRHGPGRRHQGRGSVERGRRRL